MKYVIATIALCAGPAAAEPLLYEKGGIKDVGLVIGLKAGADFSQPFNDLGTSPSAELEFGYLLPALERSIEIFVAGQWASASGEGALSPDSRLPGDQIARYTVDQSHARLTLGARYRIPVDASIRPYVGLGGRLWLVRSTIDSEAGDQNFGTYVEESTEVGVVGSLGGEWHLASGAILLELQGGYASQDRTIFQSSAVGTLGVSVGWRFFL